MYAAKNSLSRRTFLKGVGITMGLPLLDSMVPAFAATRNTAAAPVKRLSSIYIPHGAVMDKWIPEEDGIGNNMSPILNTLEPFKEDFSVVTGLDNAPALIQAGEPLGGHANISGAWLSGVHAKPTEGAEVEAGITIDQIVAKEFSKHTQLASLELGLEGNDMTGACDVGFSCAYVNTVSWRTSTTPLPIENNPRAVFERLFGDSNDTSKKARLERIEKNASILDSVTDKVASLRRKIATGDQSKLTEYLEAVRDIERRIQKAEEQSDRELPEIERPNGGIPESFKAHCELMMDLQTIAYQTDMTRVITFMISKEISNHTYPEIGVPDPHHPLSHHQNDPEKFRKLVLLQKYHLEMLSYFMNKLKSTPDGDGTLLDNVTILYGSGMGDSNLHDPRDLPILVAGGGSGTLQGNRHIRCPKGTPLTNLYLTLLDKLGVPADSIGDSTGQMQQLSDV